VGEVAGACLLAYARLRLRRGISSMAMSAFSWNSELASGRSPFWIRDEALAGLGLHAGDAVGVDTRAEARDGDLVVVEVEIDGDSQRLARVYRTVGDRVRLEPVSTQHQATGEQQHEAIEVEPDSLIVMGVIASRLRFSGDEAIEEPLHQG
jgi:SOS-response transcriptional repressor LexA